ncbi:MAG: outer membrane protein assembly factor [Bacteroidales bacterium]|nr:outer membrane protein assembly factor [Bacteroidales bacterium]
MPGFLVEHPHFLTFVKTLVMHQTQKKNIVYNLLIALSVFSQCSVSRHLADNQKLLVKNVIQSDNRKVDTDEMLNYVKPKPNRALWGFHTRLYFYYAFEHSERRFGTWMRDIVGEAPVLYDSTFVAKNEEQLRLYLNELGYYNASVGSRIRERGWNDKKVVVSYQLETGTQYKIVSCLYQSADSSIGQILDKTEGMSKLKRGKPFSIALLQEEQERIVSVCRTMGYYAFSKDNVLFSADTTHGPDSVALVISIKKTSDASLKKHVIGAINIKQGEGGRSVLHSENRKGKQRKNKFESPTYIKEQTIQQANFIEEKKMYSSFRESRTQKILSSYPIVKLVAIEFKPSLVQPNDETVKLDCSVDIVAEKKQSLSFEVEGTNTSGDWGAELNASYVNRNVFHGAEFMTVQFKFAEEYNNVLRGGEETNRRFFNSQEYGIGIDFTTPKFLLPFNSRSYDKKFRAKTNCHVEYNFLQTTDYTRPTTEINFGYIWYGKRFWTFNLNPIDISYIRYYDISDRFKNFINRRDYYKYSYEDYLLYCNNFSVVFYNKRNIETRDYQYFKVGAETSGNLMYAYCKAIDKVKNDVGQYETFNLPFAQYAKIDIDYRYYDVVSNRTTFVYRVFGGLAMPYLNSAVLPSLKKYYSGGANSMRAWESRSLGLGSHVDTAAGFKYYLGDIKLELNLESRFHLFWIIDGAAFIDIGNIWAFDNNELTDAIFHIRDFYKDLAVGTGFGLRFDFSFLILRCDLGLKVREAYSINNTNKHLIWGNRDLTKDDWNLSVGIGYPF